MNKVQRGVWDQGREPVVMEEVIACKSSNRSACGWSPIGFGFVCSLPMGHCGDHIAASANFAPALIFARWKRDGDDALD